MLKKLLKYDLKNMYKFLSIFYILSIFFAITTRILFIINKSTIIYIISKISEGCMIAMIANIIINTLMRNWIRFKETLYGDESYLTHTLPVEKKTLYLEKFLLSIINIFTSFIVIIISLLITYYTKDNFLILKQMINGFVNNYNINYISFIISIILILVLEIYSCLQSGFLGIILGHRKNDKKILFSIIYGFMTYMLTQLSIILMTFIFGLFNKNIMKLFTSNIIDSSLLKSLIIFSLVIYLIIIIIQKLLGENLLNKGVNVD